MRKDGASLHPVSAFQPSGLPPGLVFHELETPDTGGKHS
ncbi:hypothetical protein DA2_2792 [Desulfovibrio sp. A2]|nr:hypothetical protein DA2_2792 [Desulfovibrio sp. A2]